MEKVKALVDMIQQANKIAVLTGAGISVDSGIPDFRTSQGAFWLTDMSRMRIMSASYRDGHPKDFWPKFKKIFEIKIGQIFDPNYGHIFLKELEDMGKDVKIVTQNVDGLHQDAGSTTVYELHGTMKHAICPKCKTKYGIDHVMATTVPRCTKINAKGNACNFILKPDVVLFGDMVKEYKQSEQAMKECDLVLVLGSSLQVPPANMLPLIVTSDWTKKSAIINLHATDYDECFNLVIHDSITETFKKVKEAMV